MPTDQELIAAAIASGKVRVIPPGVSGLPQDAPPLEYNVPTRYRAKQSKRRQLYIRMIDKGLTPEQIAHEMGVGVPAVIAMAKLIGKPFLDRMRNPKRGVATSSASRRPASRGSSSGSRP